MPKLPRDVSSKQIIAALKRLGFEAGPKKSGSHQTFVKHDDFVSVTVVLGKSAIPQGTLAAIIRRSGVTIEEFLKALHH